MAYGLFASGKRLLLQLGIVRNDDKLGALTPSRSMRRERVDVELKGRALGSSSTDETSHLSSAQPWGAGETGVHPEVVTLVPVS